MGSGFSKMKKQARLFQAQMEKTQEQAKTARFTGVSGAGLVTVVLDGEKELKEIQIKKECVDPNDIEGLQDLILAAHAEACQKTKSPSSMPGLM